MARPRILHIRPYGFEVGSVHKYGEMFERIGDMTNVVLSAETDTPTLVAEISKHEFDIGLVGGDWWGAWKGFAKLGRPYILVEHDVVTLRVAGPREVERAMLENASGVLFTSEDHLAYCDVLYNLPPTEVVHLRPPAYTLDFEPLPKLEGQTLVYAGGLTAWAARRGSHGYRAYHDIFRAFIKHGWEVHLYPCYLSAEQHRGEFQALGCVVHKEVPEADLPRELSQYTAGLQSYADECLPDAFRYTQTCRPNKGWSYLAAGIPTIGYRGGRTMDIYGGKWGVVLDSLDDIPDLELVTPTPQMRRANVMDRDIKKFERLLEAALTNPHVPTLSPTLEQSAIPRLSYPVALAKNVPWKGRVLKAGTMIDRTLALELKHAGLLSDARIV